MVNDMNKNKFGTSVLMAPNPFKLTSDISSNTWFILFFILETVWQLAAKVKLTDFENFFPLSYCSGEIHTPKLLFAYKKT